MSFRKQGPVIPINLGAELVALNVADYADAAAMNVAIAALDIPQAVKDAAANPANTTPQAVLNAAGNAAFRKVVYIDRFGFTADKCVITLTRTAWANGDVAAPTNAGNLEFSLHGAAQKVLPNGKALFSEKENSPILVTPDNFVADYKPAMAALHLQTATRTLIINEADEVATAFMPSQRDLAAGEFDLRFDLAERVDRFACCYPYLVAEIVGKAGHKGELSFCWA